MRGQELLPLGIDCFRGKITVSVRMTQIPNQRSWMTSDRGFSETKVLYSSCFRVTVFTSLEVFSSSYRYVQILIRRSKIVLIYVLKQETFIENLWSTRFYPGYLMRTWINVTQPLPLESYHLAGLQDMINWGINARSAMRDDIQKVLGAQAKEQLILLLRGTQRGKL